MDLERYDVVVVGGAFSGAVCATLLRRFRPETRVLVVEASNAFDRKVGEATVEVSGFLLHRVLGLHDLLAREHLPKHGLRYWFSDRPERRLEEMSEVGPGEIPRLPAFQLDRSKLDESLLAEASGAGAEVLRPARVTGVELGWPESRLTVEAGGGPREIACRWVVDASGRHAFLARRMGLLERNDQHPTAAAWGRWSGVLDLDGPGVVGPDLRSPRIPPLAPSRRLATNHFCGLGWWCWMIPLAGGETSVGVVWDKRLFELPAGSGLMARYRAFLESQPGLRELLAGACLDEEDFRSYAHLAYCTRQYAAPGWVLVGDAAAFIDPYYSPGLDHASISAYATARLLTDDLREDLPGPALEAAVAEHDAGFLRSYRRWFEALYQDKYETFGDAELLAAGFLMDTAMYYFGVVTPIYKDVDELGYPVLGRRLALAKAAYRVMRFYNQRLVKLARERRARGTYGRRNAGWRLLKPSPGLGPEARGMFMAGLKLWVKAELHGLGLRLSGRREAAPQPATPPPAETV